MNIRFPFGLDIQSFEDMAIELLLGKPSKHHSKSSFEHHDAVGTMLKPFC